MHKTHNTHNTHNIPAAQSDIAFITIPPSALQFSSTLPLPPSHRFYHYPTLRPSIFLLPPSIAIPSIPLLICLAPIKKSSILRKADLDPRAYVASSSSAKLLSKKCRSREKPTSTLAPMWSLPQLLEGLSKKIAFLQVRKKSKRVFDAFEKIEKI